MLMYIYVRQTANTPTRRGNNIFLSMQLIHCHHHATGTPFDYCHHYHQPFSQPNNQPTSQQSISKQPEQTTTHQRSTHPTTIIHRDNKWKWENIFQFTITIFLLPLFYFRCCFWPFNWWNLCICVGLIFFLYIFVRIKEEPEIKRNFYSTFALASVRLLCCGAILSISMLWVHPIRPNKVISTPKLNSKSNLDGKHSNNPKQKCNFKMKIINSRLLIFRQFPKKNLYFSVLLSLWLIHIVPQPHHSLTLLI